jgi:hypothetical protein
MRLVVFKKLPLYSEITAGHAAYPKWCYGGPYEIMK